MSGRQQFLALLARGPANRLNTLDAEWLDDGFDRHVELPDVFSTGTLTHFNDTRRITRRSPLMDRREEAVREHCVAGYAGMRGKCAQQGWTDRTTKASQGAPTIRRDNNVARWTERLSSLCRQSANSAGVPPLRIDFGGNFALWSAIDMPSPEKDGMTAA